jgi:cold shock CspA family protein
LTHPATVRRTHTGTVSEFDEYRGLGVVSDDGGATYGFHCTAVADGSRFVAPGARVAFSVAAGHLGRFEARGLVRIDGPQAGSG